MSRIPLQPFLKQYRGSKPGLQRKVAEANAQAQRIADYVNSLIANDPSDFQQYFFNRIAIDLRVTADEVRDAISDGGHNGISLQVTPMDREVLSRYRR